MCLLQGKPESLKAQVDPLLVLHIRDALAAIDAQYPGLIMKFGGHAMAAGLTIEYQHLDNFIKAFDEVVSRYVTEAELQHTLLIDGELTKSEFTLEVASLLRECGTLGSGFS